jgi:hypothetical protein
MPILDVVGSIVIRSNLRVKNLDTRVRKKTGSSSIFFLTFMSTTSVLWITPTSQTHRVDPGDTASLIDRRDTKLMNASLFFLSIGGYPMNLGFP